MKVSAVVQGIGKFLEAIHPPLPLSSKESLRLHTLLTAAFRKHLDEAHPRNATENLKALTHGTSSTLPSSTDSDVSRIHASAVTSADRHMTSVLTNPLFLGQSTARPGAPMPQGPARSHSPTSQRAGSFKRDDRKNFEHIEAGSQRYKDEDISKLHKVGEKRAQIALALKRIMNDSPSLEGPSLMRRCLLRAPKDIDLIIAIASHITDSISTLRPSEQENALTKMNLGQDLLVWLGNHGVEEPQLYSSNLAPFIVRCLVFEGFENAVWNWISLPITVRPVNTLRQRLPSTQWRARIVMSLIYARLGISMRNGRIDTRTNGVGPEKSPHDPHRYNAALSDLLRAFELEACRESSVLEQPFVRLGRFLSPFFTSPSGVNLNNYDKLIQTARTFEWRDSAKWNIEHTIACLELARPQTASADAAFRYLQQEFSPNSKGIHALPHERREERPARIRMSSEDHQIMFMARTAFVLWQHRQQANAFWVVSTLRDAYAGHAGLNLVEKFWSEWHAAESKGAIPVKEAIIPDIELPIVKDLARWQEERSHPAKNASAAANATLFEQLFDFKPSPGSLTNFRRQIREEVRERLGQRDLHTV